MSASCTIQSVDVYLRLYIYMTQTARIRTQTRRHADTQTHMPAQCALRLTSLLYFRSNALVVFALAC
jgi:hypothetical protein